jgi:RND family efflux transporter MFP subunit
VIVAVPIERAVADTIEFVGVTEPTVTVDLRARVNGYLEKILFKDGAHVKAGDLLFVIEQAPYQAALDAAKAQLQKAMASQKLAESQLRRITPLVQGGTVTQEEYDVQAAEVATSKADVAAAQAELRQAELNLNYTQIHAPTDGTISRREVDVGNLVQAEVTRLAQITKIDPIYAYFDLSESDFVRFMEMLRAHQIPDPVANPPVLHLAIGDSPNFDHEGRLDYRAPTIVPETGTTKRRGIFPNPNHVLVAGMYVRIRATIGAPVPRLLVEERAIGADQRGDYVLVVNDKDEVEYRPIKRGIRADELRVIEEGIGPQDRIVVNGLQRARPGAEVRPELVKFAAHGEQPNGQPATTTEAEAKTKAGQATPPEPAAPQSSEAESVTKPQTPVENPPPGKPGQ